MEQTEETAEHQNGSNGVPDPAAALKSASAQLKGVTDFLNALVVVDRYEVADIMGNVYKFAPVLPARRQMRASVQLDRFVERHSRRGTLQKAEEEGRRRGMMAGLVAYMTTLLQEPGAEDELEALFGGIHPRIWKSAQEAAVVAWDQREDLRQVWEDDGIEEAPQRLLDLFETDAIVECLVPFFARSATRIGAVMARSMGTSAAGSPPSSRPSPSQPSGS